MYMCARCEVHLVSQNERASVEFFVFFQIPKYIKISEFRDFVHRPVF
jgi:hypothetical protein